MDKFLADLSVGVIGGLVATFLALAITKLWKSIIEPWYEERVYKDAHIEGRWYSVESYSGPVNESEEFVWEIQRIGHKVLGSAVCIQGRESGKSFQIEGLFRNLILTAAYSSTDTSALDRGALTLMLVDNGRCLRGCIAYYDEKEHIIASGTIECKREAVVPRQDSSPAAANA